MTDKYDGAKFLHLREDDCFIPSEHHGGATVAYMEQDDVIKVGVAYCHPKDRYVKAYGRAKAHGMLKQLLAKPELDGVYTVYDTPTNVVLHSETERPAHDVVAGFMRSYGYVAR